MEINAFVPASRIHEHMFMISRSDFFRVGIIGGQNSNFQPNFTVKKHVFRHLAYRLSAYYLFGPGRGGSGLLRQTVLVAVDVRKKYSEHGG